MSVHLDIINPAHPGDSTGLSKALDALPLERLRSLVVLGKTEGPATLNDYSRDLAMKACDDAIRRRGGEELLDRSWRVFSTGCEGIATPAVFVFADIDDAGSGKGNGTGKGNEDQNGGPRLVFGAARSKPLDAASLCNPAHVRAAADTVRDAMARAGLTADEVRLVMVKSPVLSASATHGLAPTARRHGGSTGSSRGAAALGGALALGEIAEADLNDDMVCRDSHLFSSRTMAFSGTETDCVEAIVFGEKTGVGGDLRIGVAQLDDLLDGRTVARLIADTGLTKTDAVMFKAGIANDGRIRGRRTTVLGSDLPADKQLRSAASGLVGGWFGSTDAFISGGAEHQGPPGSCLIAVIGSR